MPTIFFALEANEECTGARQSERSMSASSSASASSLSTSMACVRSSRTRISLIVYLLSLQRSHLLKHVILTRSDMIWMTCINCLSTASARRINYNHKRAHTHAQTFTLTSTHTSTMSHSHTRSHNLAHTLYLTHTHTHSSSHTQNTWALFHTF